MACSLARKKNACVDDVSTQARQSVQGMPQALANVRLTLMA